MAKLSILTDIICQLSAISFCLKKPYSRVVEAFKGEPPVLSIKDFF